MERQATRFDKDRRSASTFFHLEDLGEGKSVGVRVSTYHHKESKRYTSTAHRITKEDTGSGFATETYSLFADSETIVVEPTARYSAAALNTLHESVLAALDGLRSEKPALERLFRPAEQPAAV